MSEVNELWAFLRVREAIGDKDGRLMQDEVVKEVQYMAEENAELRRARTWLQARNTELVLANRELRGELQQALDQLREQNTNCLCGMCEGGGLI